jgi:Bacterial protein of unknown function (DUF922)
MKSLPKQKLYYIFLMFFLIAGNTLKVSAQISDSDKIISDGKVLWDYYSGRVDDNSNYAAMTYWSVYYKSGIIPLHGDTVTADLQTWTVLKKNSWVLPDKKSNELLQHEQGHFDFAILSALEFKKIVFSTTLFKSNYAQKIDSVFKTTLNKYKQMEIQYDEETNHSLNKNGQMLWNKKFEEMLTQ